MKKHFKNLCACALLLIITLTSSAQNNDTDQALGKIEPYQIQVTYDKTSHLIFPAAIRYVDLGSDYLIAAKAEDADNVLRIKASSKEFEPETNFSVITDDGRFYTFDVRYSSCPQSLSYNLHTIPKTAQKTNSSDVLFEELGKTPVSLAALIMETIYNNKKRIVKHIGSESFGIQFLLKGIYIHNDTYYFHTHLINHTNVPFRIDFINFKIADKKTAKRTASQQRLLLPLRIYSPVDVIIGRSSEQNVFLLDQFTIDDDKILQIEIFEKNGGRHQTLQIENSDLVKARLISSMHLKF
ncbi:conjugative transposon protein TraN [Flavobacterium sp. LHD-85]|uniref:conjugative transposon protein TraN n=1 Tax=Flavobacterium sp. LHD-85 TaxID=3071410 RepID=UPI0027E187CF|nr:conjugative transposon protein TraN [Flavobacterium sp. LHD-85]MDQ6532131.1 conjugative transposon protein TraN [Flavobacterium sp. LHD-85]